MTARQDIEALLERVKSAVGPDQIADAMLAEIVRGPGHGYVPYYTADLNAIVTLIERELPGWMWTLYHEYIVTGQPNVAFLTHKNTDLPLSEGEFRGDAPTPALALCAAFLAAKLNALAKAEPK